VSGHPDNARVADALYWFMRQLTSLLCLGSRGALEVAAAAASDEARCTAVVWSLEVGASVGPVSECSTRIDSE